MSGDDRVDAINLVLSAGEPHVAEDVMLAADKAMDALLAENQRYREALEEIAEAFPGLVGRTARKVLAAAAFPPKENAAK